MVVWRYALPLIVISALLIFDDFIAVPSCVFSDTGASYGDVGTAKLKAMIVSDLLLNGSDAGFVDTIFRYNFISHFFRKSFGKLEPDILVVLGDIAAKTAKQGKSDWKEVMQQFYRVIGPMTGVPLVVGLGERDAGQCYELDEEYVGRMARELPVLDHTGSASFMFENTSFLLINSVALLCNNNSLRSGVEKLIESENFYLRAQLKESLLKSDVSDELNKHSYGFPTLKSSLPSGSGPVLLLHFPLSSAVERNCERSNVIVTSHGDSDFDFDEATPSQLMQTLSLNETEYILQSLRPRLIFSAHRQLFGVYNHNDGTPEITVPAMTWALGGRPGFVFASFGQNSTKVSHCSLAGEIHVLLSYLSIGILLLAVTIISRVTRY